MTKQVIFCVACQTWELEKVRILEGSSEDDLIKLVDPNEDIHFFHSKKEVEKFLKHREKWIFNYRNWQKSCRKLCGKG